MAQRKAAEAPVEIPARLDVTADVGVVVTEPKPDAPERFRFTFPGQQRDRFLDIADAKYFNV